MACKWAIRPYRSFAAGWGALKPVAEALNEQGIAIRGSSTLLRMDQPDGFDSPGVPGQIRRTPHPSNSARTAPRP
jgi:hypothetical protein